MLNGSNNSIGKIIRVARQKRGFTQTGLVLRIIDELRAANIDQAMSEATLSRIESDKHIPKNEVIEIIAKLLYIPTHELFEARDTALREKEDKKVPKRRTKIQFPSVEKKCKEAWEYSYPSEHTGRVWIHITPQSQYKFEPHVYSVRTGPWEYRSSIDFSNHETVSLWHVKEDDKQPMLVFFTITPPAYVVFQQSEPTSSNTIDINFRWKRIEPYPFDLIWKHSLFYIAQTLTLGAVQAHWIFKIGRARSGKVDK